jgi:rRNA maturation endonuclease Nob1
MGDPTQTIAIAVVGGLVLGFGIVFFLRAIDSRKWYVCPQCGERIRVELMEAGHCNTCGAELQREGA